MSESADLPAGELLAGQDRGSTRSNTVVSWQSPHAGDIVGKNGPYGVSDLIIL